ncbi:MAG: glycoside hydrolase family 15 protein [Solirubrobacteraceae bacterium]
MAHAEQVHDTGAPPRRTDGYLPIEDYGVIGDGRSAALVGTDGSIDWMCLPELDDPSVFAAILDPAAGGSFSLAPAVAYETRRRYLEHTNVLVTEFTTAEGSVRVTEALTVDTGQRASWRELARQVKGLSGSVPMEWRLRPRFDFGRVASEPVALGQALVYRHQKLQLALRCWDAGPPQMSGDAVQGSFEVGTGEQALIALLAGDGPALPSPERSEVERRLQQTAEIWRAWIGPCSYDGPWREEVRRSLLAIGLLTDGRTGAIAAAATTSLPEAIGKPRNYDYRFAWVRDLSFTVDALLRVNMQELSHASVGWVIGAVGQTRPRVNPVYSLTGSVIASQTKLPLTGYRATAPVHLGNQAGSQLQLGSYGDLMETVWSYVEHGHVLAPQTGEQLADCADLICSIWRDADAGLWELGDSAQYTTSKVGCWTALERLLDLVDKGQAPARHVDRWREERERIRDYIETSLFCERKNSYVMKAGSEMLDCGVLLAARRQYLDPKGPRFNATIDAIRSELHAEGPLFYRYSGMSEQENAFLACSFWMVEALALAGRHGEATELMDEMVSLGGDLGLYSEEMEPGGHQMRGNHPQALTHLALIAAAAICDSSAGASSPG